MAQQNLSRRAALRQQQLLEEKQKRTKRIVGISAGIIVVAIVAIIAIVAIPPLLTTKPTVTENQLTPPNATADHGILVGGVKPQEGKPHVVIYSDYRCPACKSYNDTYGVAINELLDKGEITVEYRTTYFLDRGKSDSSSRAAIAAATADEVGKFREYHQVLFANQSNAYSDKQLREDFAKQAGIEGADLKKFQDLFMTRAMLDFSKGAHDYFINHEIGATPTYAVGDRRIVIVDRPNDKVLVQATPDALLEAFKKAMDGTDDPTNEKLAKP